MAEDDLQAVIDYVMLLSSRGELEYRLQTFVGQNLGETDELLPTDVAEQAQVVAQSWLDADARIVRPLTPEPANSPASLEAGGRAFVQLNCYKCHGRDGRGNKEFNVGKDDWGRTAFAADLTTGTLHGGRRPVDMYWRVRGGIEPSGMPATANLSDEEYWQLVNFVKTLPYPQMLPDDVRKAVYGASELKAKKE